jgi:biopolymer transport protein ExbB/TolQ/ABC-type transporter Mla subunit MlaD
MKKKSKGSVVILTAFLLGALCSCASYVGFWYGGQFLVPPWDYLCRIIAKRNWSDWVAIAELLFFWWAVWILIFKVVARQQQQASLTRLRDRWKQNRSQENRLQFQVGTEAEFWAGRRLRRAIERFRKTRVTAQVHDVMTEMSDSEANANEATYTLVRYCVWFVPTLGFIGTVIGMGMGIAGFGNAILQAESFEQIKPLLPPITQKLALAFDTTLQALLLVGILAALSNASLREDEKVLAEVDDFCTEDVAASFEDEGGLVKEIGGHIRSVIVEQTKALQESLSAVMKNAAREITAGIAGNTSGLVISLNTILQEIQKMQVGIVKLCLRLGAQAGDPDKIVPLTEEYSVPITDVVQKITSASDALHKVSANLERPLSTYVESLERTIRECSDSGTLCEALTGLQKLAGETADRFEGSIQNLHSAISDVMNRVASSFSALHGQFSTIALSLEATSNTLIRFIEEAGVRDAGEFTKAVNALVGAMQPMPSAITSLQAASEALQPLENLAQVAQMLGGAAQSLEQSSKTSGESTRHFRDAGEGLKETLLGNKEVLVKVEGVLGDTSSSIADLRAEINQMVGSLTTIAGNNMNLLGAINNLTDAVRKSSKGVHV